MAANRKAELMTGADVSHIHETLGGTHVDLANMLGTWPVMQQALHAPEEPLKPVPLALLVRYYNKHPEDIPTLDFPGFHEVLAAAQRDWPNYLQRHPEITRPRENARIDPNSLAKTRMAVWFGSQRAAASEWDHGREPTPVQSRLWKLFMDLVETRGTDGLERFLDIVDEEARARGVEGGLDEIMQRRSKAWPKNVDEE